MMQKRSMPIMRHESMAISRRGLEHAKFGLVLFELVHHPTHFVHAGFALSRGHDRGWVSTFAFRGHGGDGTFRNPLLHPFANLVQLIELGGIFGDQPCEKPFKSREVV